MPLLSKPSLAKPLLAMLAAARSGATMLAMARIPIFVAVVTPLAAALPVHAASDWNQFRGANGQGVGAESPLPAVFTPTTHVVWKSDLPPGHSSPVLGSDRIFVTALEGESLLTIALDRKSGREVWRREAPRQRQEKLDPRNHPAAASPLTDGSNVWVFFADFGLLAYDRDGGERWRLPLGPFDNLYGMGASPILAGDLVILALDQQTDSHLLAVHRDSGEVVWRVPRPEAKTGHSTPVLYLPAGGKAQVLLPGSFQLTGYDAATGAKLWWVRGLSFEMKSTPVMSSDTLFINGYGSEFNDPGRSETVGPFSKAQSEHDTNGDRKLDKGELPEGLARGWLDFVDLDGDGALDERDWGYFRAALETRNNMMAVRLPQTSERGDLTATHVRWRYYEKVPQLPSPLLYREVLYMINDRGIVTSFRPATGEVIAQGRIAGAVDSFYSSPVAADGKVFFPGRSGRVAVLPAGGSLEPIAVNDLDETIYATPAIADGRIYLRTRSALYAFGLSEKASAD